MTPDHFLTYDQICTRKIHNLEASKNLNTRSVIVRHDRIEPLYLTRVLRL